MVYQVTLYKNTGFGDGNLPSSPAVLANAQQIQLSANQVWKLQDKYLSRVRLQMSYEDARQVDYVKIGNSFYTVAGLAMTNNVAEFTLTYDAINSVGGVGSFQILDGWAERAHANHDDLFENVIDEPYSPMKEMRIKITDLVGLATGAAGKTIVGSTVDLTQTNYVAAVYEAASSADGKMLVPDLPDLPGETRIGIGDSALSPAPASWEGKIVQQKLPNMCLYGLDTGNETRDINIKKGVKGVRRLGLVDSITACYRIPDRYAEFGFDELGGVLAASGKVITSNADSYKYGTYKPKNNKVFAVMNKYRVVSMASGNSDEYEAREIYNGESSPTFIVFADPSPKGKPYCQPSMFEGENTLPFQNATEGAEWMSTPLTFSEVSDQASLNNAYIRSTQDMDKNLTRAIIANSIQGAGAAVNLAGQWSAKSQIADTGPIGTIGGALLDSYYAGYDYAVGQNRAYFDFAKNSQIIAPEVLFARGTTLAGFIGNGFIVYHIMLSEEDMERFDNFLTMYGYAQSRRLKQDDLTSRQYFNFVKASSVAVTGPSLMDRNAIADQFAGGVRLWHVLPSRAAMSNNPIKEATP